MARSNGRTVGELCDAQASVRRAAEQVFNARMAAVRASGARPGEDFRDTPLDQRLNVLTAELHELADSINQEIREMAALIPSPCAEGGEDRA